jgi:hypothetical protein
VNLPLIYKKQFGDEQKEEEEHAAATAARMMNSEEDCIPRSEGLTGLGVKN